MSKTPFTETMLFCPGPTPVPSESAFASISQNPYHRSTEFKQEVLSARRKLQPFFQSNEKPLLLSCSGSGAMEAAVINLTAPNDRVLVINGGKFGERWSKITKAYLCDTVEIKLEWGSTVDFGMLEKHLIGSSYKAVFFQANETSTGVAHPVKEICQLIKKHSEALIVVDAVSALVAHEVNMSKWNIDCLLSGSQKGFGTPPGLAFIALSERAWSQISLRPKFYFDLNKEREGQNSGLTAWTAPTSLIRALNVSLDKLLNLGVTECHEYHSIAALACQKAAESLGLELLSKSHHSQALTAIKVPPSICGIQLLKHAKEKYNVLFAGGQDQLKGKIVRVAHLGLFKVPDIIYAMSVLELSLKDLGFDLEIGTAATTTLRVFHKQLKDKAI